MPEEENLKQEITNASYDGAKKALSEEEKEDFPTEMDVNVLNFPEQKERPEVEKVEVTNFPEQKPPVVKIPKQEPPVVNVEKIDLTPLLEAIRDNKVAFEPTDLSPLSQELEKLFKEIKRGNDAPYKGGGIGPNKIYLRKTNGEIVNPATSDDAIKGVNTGGTAKEIGVTGADQNLLRTQDNYSHLLREVLTELKIISKHLSFITDVEVEDHELD